MIGLIVTTMLSRPELSAGQCASLRLVSLIDPDTVGVSEKVYVLVCEVAVTGDTASSVVWVNIQGPVPVNTMLSIRIAPGQTLVSDPVKRAVGN